MFAASSCPPSSVTKCNQKCNQLVVMYKRLQTIGYMVTLVTPILKKIKTKTKIMRETLYKHKKLDFYKII